MGVPKSNFTIIKMKYLLTPSRYQPLNELSCVDYLFTTSVLNSELDKLIFRVYKLLSQ